MAIAVLLLHGSGRKVRAHCAIIARRGQQPWQRRVPGHRIYAAAVALQALQLLAGAGAPDVQLAVLGATGHKPAACTADARPAGGEGRAGGCQVGSRQLVSQAPAHRIPQPSLCCARAQNWVEQAATVCLQPSEAASPIRHSPRCLTAAQSGWGVPRPCGTPALVPPEAGQKDRAPPAAVAAGAGAALPATPQR